MFRLRFLGWGDLQSQFSLRTTLDDHRQGVIVSVGVIVFIIGVLLLPFSPTSTSGLDLAQDKFVRISDLNNGNSRKQRLEIGETATPD